MVKRENKKHLSQMKDQSFKNIDLVIVNFYPFEDALLKKSNHNKIIENIETLKKMHVLLSEERKVVLSHHKTFEHVEKMRSIVNESIEMVNKS